jgi:hypothetical protein
MYSTGIDPFSKQADVRRALIRALWGHLERPEAWEVLERTAAQPGSPGEALALARLPGEGSAPEARERLLTILARLARHPNPGVRLEVLLRCHSPARSRAGSHKRGRGKGWVGGLYGPAGPVENPHQVLWPHLLEALGSRLPDERAAAHLAALAHCSEANAAALGRALVRRAANLSALNDVILAVQAEVERAPGRLLPLVRAMLTALERAPLTVGLRARLAVAALPADERARLLARWVEAKELHAEALMETAAAIEQAGKRLTDGHLGRLEAALAASPDARLRRLALAALVAQTRSAQGWGNARLRRLEDYGRDSSALVAGAAQLLLAPQEQE